MIEWRAARSGNSFTALSLPAADRWGESASRRFDPSGYTQTMSAQSPAEAIAEAFQNHRSFVLMSHIRPDGDAIGSQLALGHALMEMGKTVHLINEDHMPENLAFLSGSQLVKEPPADPLDVEVAIALDTANKTRLGEKCLHAASMAKLWINIDHHVSNPGYGDINLIDPVSPATGEIVHELIVDLGMPLTAVARDAIYVAISTDTGSFQYPSTTARTYRIAADLVDRGLDVGTINSQTYDELPFRRVELIRELLHTLELAEGGRVAHWELREKTRTELALRPEDSEGLIDIIRSIRGVQLAVFLEDLPEGKVRVSMRSKDPRIDVCKIATVFGGGGHALAAGIRMPGPIDDAKEALLAEINTHFKAADI